MSKKKIETKVEKKHELKITRYNPKFMFCDCQF